MMTADKSPLPQDDIPGVDVVVNHAILRLNGTQSFRDFAGNPLRFLLRDVNTRPEDDAKVDTQ